MEQNLIIIFSQSAEELPGNTIINNYDYLNHYLVHFTDLKRELLQIISDELLKYNILSLSFDMS